MTKNIPTLASLLVKASVVHTVTYFVMGLLALIFLDYADRFAQPYMLGWMRQVDDPIVMAGPLFQPLRGVLFALAFYPLREILFGRKYGWLTMGWLLVSLGVFSTFGPTPGSVEGMIYTLIPLDDQLTGWLEVIPQSLLLAFALHYWVNHPEQKWLNWVLGILFTLMMAMVGLGLLVG